MTCAKLWIFGPPPRPPCAPLLLFWLILWLVLVRVQLLGLFWLILLIVLQIPVLTLIWLRNLIDSSFGQFRSLSMDLYTGFHQILSDSIAGPGNANIQFWGIFGTLQLKRSLLLTTLILEKSFNDCFVSARFGLSLMIDNIEICLSQFIFIIIKYKQCNTDL